jgi:hypothetical protein
LSLSRQPKLPSESGLVDQPARCTFAIPEGRLNRDDRDRVQPLNDRPWHFAFSRGDEGGQKKGRMPKYVIERELPGAGELSREQLQAVAQKSCDVLVKMGPQIQWLHSYVTTDKIYCVYYAANERLIREHADKGGFPANRISEVKDIIDPATAEPYVPSADPAVASV